MASLKEIPSQSRLEKCSDIAQRLWDNWSKTRQLDYRIVSAERFDGKSLEELGKLYVSVGLGDELIDLPFMDLLTVFHMLSQTRQQMDEHVGKATIELHYEIKTEWEEWEVLDACANSRSNTRE